MMVKAVIDDRTTLVCLNANGMIEEADDSLAAMIAANQPEVLIPEASGTLREQKALDMVGKSQWNPAGYDPEFNDVASQYADYIVTDGPLINGALRGITPYAYAEEKAMVLDVAFVKSQPIDSPMAVYRGIGNADDILTREVGAVITDLGFTSTSPTLSWAERFIGRDGGAGALLEIRVPAGAKVVDTGRIVTSLAGRLDVDQKIIDQAPDTDYWVDVLGNIDAQDELLLPRGGSYRYLGMNEGRIVLEAL